MSWSFNRRYVVVCCLWFVFSVSKMHSSPSLCSQALLWLMKRQFSYHFSPWSHLVLGLLVAVQVSDALWGTTGWGEWKKPGASVHLDQKLCVRIGWSVCFSAARSPVFKVHMEHHLQQNKYLGMSRFTQQKCFWLSSPWYLQLAWKNCWRLPKCQYLLSRMNLNIMA